MILVVAAVGSSAAGFLLVAAPPASASVCGKLPGLPIVPDPIKIGCTGVGTITKIVTDPIKIITDPIRAVGDDVMQGVTSWVADGAAWLIGQAAALINQTTTPTLSAAWFTGQYATMAGLAAVFALPLLFLAVLEGVLKRDGRIILRAVGVHLPAAFLLTAGAVVVVGMFIALTDQMCGQLTGSVSGQASTFFSDVAKALSGLASQTGSPVVPLFAVFLGGLIAAVGSFFVWIELLIRAAGIYVAVLFLPFTFVAMIWPQTARWCRRLVELLFAIIFSKFAIVAIMALAAAGLLSGGSSTGFTGVLAGAALMLLAAFSPLALLRLLPMVEGAAHAHANRSGAGSQTLGPVAGPAAVMRRVIDGNWGSGGGGLRAAPAAAGGGPAGVAAAGAGAAARGATRAASGAAAGSAGQARSATGGPGATPGQDGGRYAATNGSASSVTGRPGNGGSSAPGQSSATPASLGATSSQGGSATTSSSSAPAGSAPTQARSSSTSGGASSPPPSAAVTPASPGAAASPGGSARPSAAPQAPSPARAELSRSPVVAPRDPARERANDQQTRGDA